jgi:hypothetical protein
VPTAISMGASAYVERVSVSTGSEGGKGRTNDDEELVCEPCDAVDVCGPEDGFKIGSKAEERGRGKAYMRVMICALDEKPSASGAGASDSGASVSSALATAAEEATSLRTSVLANRTVLSCARMRACSVAVVRDHSWPNAMSAQ